MFKEIVIKTTTTLNTTDAIRKSNNDIKEKMK